VKYYHYNLLLYQNIKYTSIKYIELYNDLEELVQIKRYLFWIFLYAKNDHYFEIKVVKRIDKSFQIINGSALIIW